MSAGVRLRAAAGGLALALAALAGCSGDEQELTQWIDQQRREVKPSVQPLQAPKKFDPEAYAGLDSVDPFSSQKLTVVLRQEARQPSSVLAVELNRRKEPLENFPLDSMAMVGSVSKNGRQHALLRVDKLLYQVAVGDHIGQNFGLVTGITETEVRLRELVQDAGGEWIERPMTLQLQEGSR
jgi:type IV pilus assembly protein PilP